MVFPYFEGAESISGLGLPQFQGFGPRLGAETGSPDIGHDPQMGLKSGPELTLTDAQPTPTDTQLTPTDAQLTPTDTQPTADGSWVNVLGPRGPIPGGMWG